MILTMTEQEALVEKGYAKKSMNGNLATYKYARKVFYDNLWVKAQAFECRGHTYDVTDGSLVLAAPTKSFNYLENNNWGNVDVNSVVSVYKKVNGFMATARMYKGELVIGTTGTTNSGHAALARVYIKEHMVNTHFTTIFEVCDEADPHIVHEKIGAHVLGFREVVGSCEYTPCTDQFVGKMSLKSLLDILHNCKGEGYMAYNKEGSACKFKSPYYLGKKALMRIHHTKWDAMVQGNMSFMDRLDGRWHNVVDELIDLYGVDFAGFDEQGRRRIIEDYESIGGW